MSWLWASAFCAIAALLAYLEIVRRDLHRIRRFDEEASRFFDRIKPVVADDETPESVLRIIESMNATIHDPRSAKALCYVLTHKLPDYPSEDREAFFERRPELFEPYADALVSGLLATTYRSWLWGPHARRLLAVARRHREIAPFIASDLRNKASGGRMNNGAALAAA